MKYIVLIKDKIVIKNIVPYSLTVVENPTLDRNIILTLNYDISDEAFQILLNIFTFKNNKSFNDTQAIELTKKLYDMIYELEQLKN